MRERIVRKFNQNFQSFAAAVVKEQHVGTELAQSRSIVLAVVRRGNEMQGLNKAVVDVDAVAVISPSYEADDNDVTLVQHRLQQTMGCRQHCLHGGKLHSDW